MVESVVTMDGLRCSSCGGPMPPIQVEAAARALIAARGATLLCGACSGLALTATESTPAGRHFELVVELVEVIPPADGTRDGSRKLLQAFRAAVTAPSLDAAMRPLALEFGEKWQRAEASTHIADS